MLGKGWDSDLRIHHMFFRFPPYYLLLTTYDWKQRYALCLPSEAASRRRALPVLRSPAKKDARGCAMLPVLWALLYGGGAELDGRISGSYGLRNARQKN